MKKRDLLTLWYIFENLQKEKTNVNFSYAVAKNRMGMKAEVEALEEARKPSDDFAAYEQERISLIQKFAEKDDQGQIKATDDRIALLDPDKFKEEFDKLQEKYADAIKETEEQAKEFNLLLDDEVEFEVYPISLDTFPEKIEPEIMEVFVSLGLVKEGGS